MIYSIPPTPSTRVGLLIAFYCTQFYLAEGNLIFSLISRNIAGHTKTSTTRALTSIFGAAGNMAAPQLHQKSDAPRYRKGFTAHFCLYVLFNIFLGVLRVLLVRRNKQKAALEARVAPAGTGAAQEEEERQDESKNAASVSHANAFADMTDKENPAFRYEM